MNKFVKGVSDDLQKECHLAMIHDNMNIYHLIFHAQHVKEPSSNRKSRDAKREKPFYGCSTKGRLDIQDKPRFKKRVSNPVTSMFP